MVQKFIFLLYKTVEKNNKIKTRSSDQSAILWIANWCQSEVCTICTNTCCETAMLLAYCCDCDRVVHLSTFSSAFVYQQQRHKVKAAQVWWLNLIIKLATVSIIHVQKNNNYQNNPWWESVWLLFCEHSVDFTVIWHQWHYTNNCSWARR